MKRNLLFSVVALGLAATPLAAEIQQREFKVVGTWGNLASWTDLEQPFWAEKMPAATDGKITASAIPITEAGLKGGEVMRLLNLGVFEVAHGLGSYVASENPAIEGVDLSSIAPDFTMMRAISDAYRDTMDKTFRETYGATIVALHPWPASMIYCNKPIASIADIKGRKVRVHSATLGDFVEGAGGVAVTLPFAEVVPALERGVADCAITDPMSAYNAKWQEVITHVFPLRVGYSITYSAINLKLWESLDEETRSVMQAAFTEMENEGWESAERKEALGVACLTGGDCPLGEAGGATLATVGEADVAARQAILDDFVLKRWGDRCGADCAATWNATAGAVAGLVVPTN
ncbi:MAG TPA: TRAP transporter substrate-binding protein [Roseovarius sp.]